MPCKLGGIKKTPRINDLRRHQIKVLFYLVQVFMPAALALWDQDDEMGCGALNSAQALFGRDSYLGCWAG